MPVRHEGTNIPKKTTEERLMEIGQMGVFYARLKNDEKKIGEQIDEKKVEIKSAVLESQLYVMNGNHKELTAPLGDGLNEVFVQIQVAESISPVDNIIQLLRDKLGASASSYIMTKEVLHPTALDTLFNNGLITAQDVEDWTTRKEVERLIIKVNKVTKKKK